jgi:predicted Zn-dependent protease
VARVAGRKEFQYEFNVILEDKINAFALPGGKIFLNAGAIKSSNSEAELVGLLAHEVSHAVLSHGFQLVTEGNLLSNVTQFIPLGGTIAQLFVLDYSREMERQADILGTRMLTSLGYAADGLRNLMVTLKQEAPSHPYSWLATHPVTDERIRYLEELIQRNGYNRYTYEGVARHTEMRQIASTLLAEAKQRQELN